MARFDNAHSRFVAWAKIALPLVALAILSTLFLVARPVDPEGNLPFSEREIDELLRDERLSNPAFAGVTEDGTALTVGADVAQPDPDNPSRALAEGLSARMELVDSGWLTIAAGRGVIDQNEGTARFEGGVRLQSQTGYDVRTSALSAQLDRTRLESDGQAFALGPPGRIEAGRILVRRDDEGPYLIEFADGVRLLYIPPTDP